MEAEIKSGKRTDMQRKTIHDTEVFLIRNMRIDEFETRAADVEVFARLTRRNRLQRPH